jgi:hypothetical protein
MINSHLGAVAIGTIETDLTFLIEEGLTEPHLPTPSNTYARSRRKHWEAHYELLFIVEGRSMRFEARWPAKKNLPQGRKQKVLVTNLVEIASSFPPVTA